MGRLKELQAILKMELEQLNELTAIRKKMETILKGEKHA